MTPAAPSPRLEDFSAPYHFFAEKLYVTYRVPRRRLEAALPRPYAARAILGQYLVVLEVAHFFHVTGSGKSPPIASYNEIIHFTPAVVQNRPTVCMWKLYLDDSLPILLGRELYGFPKFPSQITYLKEPARISVSVTPEKGSPLQLDINRHTWRRFLPSSDVLVNRFAAQVATQTELLFVHPSSDTLTCARLYDASISGTEVVRVEQARIPLFQEINLLDDAQLTRPFLTVHLSSFRISLGPPSQEQLRAAATPVPR